MGTVARNVVLLSPIFILSMNAFAAVETHGGSSSHRLAPQTLMGDEVEHGGYAALVSKYGKLTASDAFLLGGRAAWVLNHHFAIGAAGYGLLNQVASPNTTYRYGGGFMEYDVASDRLLHFTLGALIGGGYIRLRGDGFSSQADSFFVLEPEANLVINISQNFHAAAGVSYKATRGIDKDGLTNKDLSGVNAGVMLEFGAF